MLWLDDSLVARIILQKRALMFSWITVLILFIFQPFGTYESELSYKYLRLAGYGVATFLAIFIAGMIEVELSKHKKNIKNYPQLIISLYIVIAALFNHSYFVVAIYGHWHWLNQLMFIFYVSVIAVFPVSIIYLRNNKSTAATDCKDSDNTKMENCDSNFIGQSTKDESVEFQIIGENKSDILSLTLNDIIVMRSADNYCEIITQKEQEVRVNLLRISLSKALEQLPDNPFIIRCHRSFGVNLSLVKTYQGNANGLKLEMLCSDIIVPVSRAYVSEVKQALSIIPKHSQSSQ